MSPRRRTNPPDITEGGRMTSCKPSDITDMEHPPPLTPGCTSISSDDSNEPVTPSEPVVDSFQPTTWSPATPAVMRTLLMSMRNTVLGRMNDVEGEPSPKEGRAERIQELFDVLRAVRSFDMDLSEALRRATYPQIAEAPTVDLIAKFWFTDGMSGPRSPPLGFSVPENELRPFPGWDTPCRVAGPLPGFDNVCRIARSPRRVDAHGRADEITDSVSFLGAPPGMRTCLMSWLAFYILSLACGSIWVPRWRLPVFGLFVTSYLTWDVGVLWGHHKGPNRLLKFPYRVATAYATSLIKTKIRHQQMGGDQGSMVMAAMPWLIEGTAAMYAVIEPELRSSRGQTEVLLQSPAAKLVRKLK